MPVVALSRHRRHFSVATAGKLLLSAAAPWGWVMWRPAVQVAQELRMAQDPLRPQPPGDNPDAVDLSALL